MDRSFWPFPERPVVIDESRRPPGPGETPPPFTAGYHIREQDLRRQIESLGSPAVSEIVELPLRREGGSASFGLDLSKQLAKISGVDGPGHYLVGLRSLNSGSERAWMRLQVTDLCLTVIEEPHEVRFVVTSLSTGQPVEGAEVRVEGSDRGKSSDWRVMVRGTSGADGAFRWVPEQCRRCSVLRIVVAGWRRAGARPDRAAGRLSRRRLVRHRGDLAAVDDRRHLWRGEQPTRCRTSSPSDRSTGRTSRCYIKGYVRERDRGRLRLALDADGGRHGPGDLVWRYPVDLTPEGLRPGSFEGETGPPALHRLPRGLGPERQLPLLAEASFRLEAYRIPRFQVDLHAPERVPLDRPRRCP